MKYGVVNTNIADIWSKPKLNSERLNQVLFTDRLKILKFSGDYSFVKESDGYQGWINSDFVTYLSKNEFDKLNRKSRLFVKTKEAKIIGDNNQELPPHLLYYGTKLATSNAKSSYSKIIQPNYEFFIKSNNLAPTNSITDMKYFSPIRLVTEARKFLGTPYLWGGITPLGWDCSGFLRTIFRRFGITLPRDTKDQISVGTEVELSDIRVGDLLFFKRHVAIAINKTEFIHSSIDGNGVRVNSMLKEKENYRKDLAKTFKEVRRVF